MALWKQLVATCSPLDVRYMMRDYSSTNIRRCPITPKVEPQSLELWLSCQAAVKTPDLQDDGYDKYILKSIVLIGFEVGNFIHFSNGMP